MTQFRDKAHVGEGTCRYCNGWGFIVDRTYGEVKKVTCWKCKGRGYRR